MSAGDRPEEGAWPLWEVFSQAKEGAPHEHVGSVHAPDAEMALQHARDTYARRPPLLSLWVVPTEHIVASAPRDREELFDPATSKIYRHPQFYKVPRGVRST